MKEINSIVEQVLGIHLDSTGKIKIPEKCKRVKLDVGLSNNAPHSELWLKSAKNDDTCVYGFEPNPYNVKYIRETPLGHSYQGIQVDPNRIDDTFFVVQSAVSCGEPRYSDFYCTEGDPGTSSIYKPNTFKVLDICVVNIITLKDFFDLFPWDKIPYIEQLKTDTQSSDFDVIKGCGEYLSERVVYLDVEISTNNQYEKDENPEEFHNYILSQGFECFSMGGNCSYYNKKFSNILNTIDYKFLNS
jgi:hypothetical protein